MLYNDKNMETGNIIAYKDDLKRFYLNKELTDMDIIGVFKLNPVEFLKNKKFIKNNPKFRILTSIYFSPFILCDQSYLSDSIRSILPLILNTRYEMEMEELDYYYENSSIGNEEYKNMQDKLSYYYYYSSEDGKKALNIKNTVQNKKTMI